MSAALLDGRELAKTLREKYKAEVAEAALRTGRPVLLRTLRVGDAEDARLYEDAIGRLMEKVGVQHQRVALKPSATAADVRSILAGAASDASVTGVLVLSPMPSHLPYQELVAELPAHKDAEGTRYEAGSSASVFPPTALACFELVKAAGLPIAGRGAPAAG